MRRIPQSALLALVLAVALPLCAQLPRTKRLILKDGSYQLATQWQQQNDRVRYYSSERDEWEELPSSLVDWTATNKYNQELENGEAADQQRLSAEDAAEQAAQQARSPQIAPGLHLPDSGGVYLLDEFGGKQELVELAQSGGDIHRNMGRNILRAAINPVASSHETIEVPGARARVQAHQLQPAIYVDVSDEEAAPDSGGPSTASPNPAPADRFRIVRMKPQKQSRVVGDLKIAFYGKVSQEASWVPAQSVAVSSDWEKVVPSRPLTPGEYALVEMLGKNQINLYVWDFGVDPSAPANPPTWVPVQPKQMPTGTDANPVLNPRSTN